VGASQLHSGGNPGDYLQVANHLNSGPQYTSVLAFHHRFGAEYSPSIEGAISQMEFSIDYKFVSRNYSFPGDGMGFKPALRQNGNFYFRPGGITGERTSWDSHSVILGQTDFGLLYEADSTLRVDMDQNPDFGPTGSPIELGFGTSNSTGGWSGSPQPYKELVAAYDNWTFAITPVPEPSSIVVLSLLAILGIAVHWRRRRVG